MKVGVRVCTPELEEPCAPSFVDMGETWHPAPNKQIHFVAPRHWRVENAVWL